MGVNLRFDLKSIKQQARHNRLTQLEQEQTKLVEKHYQELKGLLNKYKNELGNEENSTLMFNYYVIMFVRLAWPKSYKVSDVLDSIKKVAIEEQEDFNPNAIEG